MKKTNQTDIASTVMDQIKHGSVRMRPRLYFTALTAVSIAAVAASALSIAYLTSIVFFWVRIETASTMAWGARAKLSDAVDSFPWWTLIISLVLLIAATFLVKHHGRMYRHRTGVVMLSILVVSLLIGLSLSLADISSMHSGSSPATNSQQHGTGRQHLNE